MLRQKTAVFDSILITNDMRKLAPSVDTNDNSVMSSYQAAETYKNMFPGQCASASIAIQPF